MNPGLPGIFVVGTDTGVGKTRVAAGVARALVREGHRVGVLKPVATGATRVESAWRSDDAERLLNAVGGGVPIERVAPLIFEEPLAPCIAARRAGTPLDHDQVVAAVNDALAWWSQRADVMVVEGVGGLLCPLAEGTTVADLAIALDYPLLIVARRGLGTLNHTLLTVEAAVRRALRLAGVVLNSPEPGPSSVVEETNARELARRLPGVAILAEIPFEAGHASPDPILATKWYDLLQSPRIGSGG